MTLVEGYLLSAVVESDPNELGATKVSKRRSIQLMSKREADEEAKHGEVLRWSPTVHYVTTGLPNALASLLILFWRPFLTFFIFVLAPEDEARSQDVGDGRGDKE